jgi:hypothetical protein
MTTRKSFRVVLATGLVALAAALASGDASAYRYWTTGAVGPSSTYPGICRYMDAWRLLQISTPPPLVFARDNNYGGGNDAQWVRFRTFLVSTGGSTIRANDYSEWRVAYDNSPAAFSPSDPRLGFTGVPDGSMIDIRIEWWRNGMLGAVADRVYPYAYFRGATGPFGWAAFCAVH